MAIGTGALAAITLGSGLLNALGQGSANRAATDARNKELAFSRRVLNERRADPILAQLQGQFEQAQQQADTIPALFRRRQAGALASQAQLQRQRLNESLARAGQTGASETAIRAQRGFLGGLEQQRMTSELGAAQLQSQLQGRVSGMGTNILNQRHGSPGQAIAGIQNSVGQFTNPADPILSGLTSFATGLGIGGAFQPKKPATGTVEE